LGLDIDMAIAYKLDLSACFLADKNKPHSCGRIQFSWKESNRCLMLFLYDKKLKSIEPCKETNLKAHSLLERQDLEKWIENYPEMLGEELLLLTAEYDRFDKTSERLDLLALDKEGSLVIIELKRDDSGKYVDLQALKYAAYCSTLRLQDVVELYQKYLTQRDKQMSKEEARQNILDFIENDEFEEINEKPRIILVSKEFRSEVTACVLWLRKFGMDITCVKLSPYEVDDGHIALDSSILIPLPEAKEFMVQSEKKEGVEYVHTVSQAEYIKFYSDLVSRIKKQLSREYMTPSPTSYYQISTGISGVHFEWAFHGRPRSSFGVELHFEKSNKASNLGMIERMEQLKNVIEKELAEKVIFQKEWGKTFSRLFVEKQEGKITEELKAWAIEKMVNLINILQPELDKMKSS